ncbi:hypothetical protein HYS28_02125 [Candidatus Uhrbacteria bacterium]|nr:hypothetical protein [Candidatus Uhrbacteria bacterium]
MFPTQRPCRTLIDANEILSAIADALRRSTRFPVGECRTVAEFTALFPTLAWRDMRATAGRIAFHTVKQEDDELWMLIAMERAAAPRHVHKPREDGTSEFGEAYLTLGGSLAVDSTVWREGRYGAGRETITHLPCGSIHAPSAAW